MALHFELDKIEDFKNLCFVEDGVDDKGEPRYQYAPVTQALIQLQMATCTGGSITAANVDEVAARIAIIERIDGAWVRDGNGAPRPITWADVHAHIGLWTNAYTKSKREFKERIMRGLFRQANNVVATQRKKYSDGLSQLAEVVAGA